MAKRRSRKSRREDDHLGESKQILWEEDWEDDSLDWDQESRWKKSSKRAHRRWTPKDERESE